MGVEKVLSAEEQKRVDALLAQFEQKVKSGIANYAKETITPEMEAIKQAQLTAEGRLKVVEEMQKIANDAEGQRKSEMQNSYYAIFNDAKEQRHRRGIDEPSRERKMIGFLYSIYNATDGNAAKKNLEKFEQKFGIKLPELQTTFEAMGHTKSILSIGSPQEAGFIVPTPLTMEYIEALYAMTFFSKVGVRKLAMPNGNLKMPRVGAKATATYTGESQKLAKTNPKMEIVQWIARKLGGIIVYTRDLFFAAPIGIENIIMDDMNRVMNLKKEYTALYGTGVDGIPAGLDAITGIVKNGSSSTVLTSDTPAQIVARLESTNIVPNFAWVMHPQAWWYIANLKTTTGAFIFKDEMMIQKTLLGYPFAKTTQSLFNDTGTYATSHVDIWFGNWSELILAQFRDMEVTVSDQGSFTDDAGNMVSCVENDLMMIRFIDQHDFNIRHVEAIQKNTHKLAAT